MLDFKLRSTAYGTNNLSFVEVDGTWGRIISEVVAFCNVSDPNDYGNTAILLGADDHIIIVQVSELSNVLIEDSPSMRYLNGKREKAFVDKNVMLYGYSALAGFVGEDGQKYIAVGSASDIGKRCPILSIYQVF